MTLIGQTHVCPARRIAARQVGRVDLVCLVYLVDLVHLVNQINETNKINRITVFLILLGWPAMASGIAQIRKSVLTLALPVTVSSLLQRTEGIAAVFLVGGLGATSIAAVGLGQLLAFIATTLVSGLSVGANVLIAQLWGARRTKDVGEAATHLLGLAAIVSCSLVAFGLSMNRVT